MKKVLLIIAIGLTLANCQGTKLGNFVATIESAATGTVSPEAIYIARNAFDTAEVSATNYLNLKRCPVNAPFCRQPIATQPIIDALRSGRDARNAATLFLKQHPNQLGTQGLYDALTTATDTIKGILARYNAVGAQ
jgi:hypothetical protein